MANVHRGEVKVRLAGKDYVMAPTWEAITEIEQLTGRGVVELANRVMQHRYGAQEVAAIVFAGIKSGGNEFVAKPTFEGTGRMIMADGVANFAAPVTMFLANALSGGETPKPGEAGAAAAE
jgi:hypothetical protein